VAASGSGDGTMDRPKASIMREAWEIARPYWLSSDERWIARGLFVAIVILSLIDVWINVRLNTWRNDFYNALQEYDEPAFFYQLGLFTVLASLFIVLSVYQVYLQQMLQIRWRRWMTSVYLKEWLADKTYYRLQLGGDGTDNPDQRIADDLNLFPAQTLNLTLGLGTNIVQAVSFAVILWNLSGPLAVPLGAMGEVEIPGYMLWAVLIYTGFFTWMTIKLGRPLVALNFDQQRFEADLRFSLVRLRENTESVAFYGGEDREYGIFWGRFGKVFANYWAIMLRTRLLGFVQGGSGQAAVIFPYLIDAPKFFTEHPPLGQIQQVADAFIQLQGSLAYIINAYNDIANWQSVIHRLATFRQRAAELQAAQRAPQPIALTREGDGVSVADLSLDLPGGQHLRDGIGFDVKPGEALLITGRTGTGKSTVLRAVAGIWPFGHGRVRLGAGRAFFIPQRAYIPLGDLRHALLYPDDGTGVPRERLAEVMEKVGLGHLVPELDKVDNWAHRLSGGEQQRLAFARVLLAEPRIIFLDEATAALDEAGEALLYRLVRALPGPPTIVSVGHRGTLHDFHDRELDLAKVGHAGSVG
jgi:putative ATP-binding cassette transporter